MARSKTAVSFGPISNSTTLVTGNKVRLPGKRVLAGRFNHLVAQLLHKPVTTRIL